MAEADQDDSTTIASVTPGRIHLDLAVKGSCGGRSYEAAVTIDVREDGVFRAVRRRQRELEGGACSCATRPTRAAPAQSTFLLRFLLAVWVHTLGGLKPDAAVSAVTKWFVRRSAAPA